VSAPAPPEVPASARQIRVLIADDHAPTREDVKRALTNGGMEVCAEAADAARAVQRALETQPDICLLDLRMPGGGLAAAWEIAARLPTTKIVVLTVSDDDASLFGALRAGAVGYLVKTADPAELALAVRAAKRGEKFLSSAISAHVVDACLGRVDREQTSLERLTQRQREVLQLIAEGHTTKEIAKDLNISTKTAEAYRGELMKALDIHDIASLTRYAIRSGLVSPDY